MEANLEAPYSGCGQKLYLEVMFQYSPYQGSPFSEAYCAETETPWHMVWTCLASVTVWQECYRHIQKLSLKEDDGLGWFLQLRERITEDELTEAVTMARLIWLCRKAGY